MAILTLSGRAAMASAIAQLPIHLAWGTGDPAWDKLPEPESTLASGLVNEIGRRALTLWQFVVPDVNGAITVPSVDDPSIKESFAPSPGNAPTNHLYLLFNFDFEDAPHAEIREVGVFVSTVTDPALPPGQKYFTPGEIIDPGILLALERLPLIPRQPSLRQSFEQVITI